MKKMSGENNFAKTILDLKSSQKLPIFNKYALWTCAYAAIAFSCFVYCCFHFFELKSLSSEATFHEFNRSICLCTSGGLLSNIMYQLLDTMESDFGHGQLIYAVCTVTLNLIAFCSHFLTAINLGPVVMNPFGHASRLIDFAERLATVPLQIIVIRSLDQSGNLSIWTSTRIQLLSVILIGVAQIVQDTVVASALLALSTISVVHLFFHCNHIVANISQAFKQSYNKKSIEVDVVEEALSLSRVTAYFLDLSMSCSLLLFTTVQLLGTLNIINSAHECATLRMLDFLTQIVLLRQLSTWRATRVSPEGVLLKLLAMEQQASSNIRQFLRFICHEISTYLNAISMCLDGLSDKCVDDDGVETISMARDGCNEIKATTRSILRLQQWTDASVMLVMSPFDVKEAVRDCARKPAKLAAAEAKHLTTILVIDSRIPDLLRGDKVRIQHAISAIIDLGIFLAQPHKKVTIVAEMIPAVAVDQTALAVMESARIRFELRSDRKDLSDEALTQFFNPVSLQDQQGLGGGGGSSNEAAAKEITLRSNMAAAKDWISIHGGRLSWEVSTGIGFTIWFELELIIPLFLDGDLNAGCEVINGGVNDTLKNLGVPLEVLNPGVSSDGRSKGVHSQQFSRSSFWRSTLAPVAAAMTQTFPLKERSVPPLLRQATAPRSAAATAAADSSSSASAGGAIFGSAQDWGGDANGFPAELDLQPQASVSLQMQLQSARNIGDTGRASSGGSKIASAAPDELQQASGGGNEESSPELTLATSATETTTRFTRGETRGHDESGSGSAAPASKPKREKKEVVVVPAVSTALVVDDVVANTKLCCRCLERIGFACELAFDGQEALDKILKDGAIIKEYDVVILDNIMPKMSGLDTVQYLRKSNYTKLIVGLTANCLDEDVAEFKEAGCDDVLGKPLVIPRFKAILDAHGIRYVA